MMYALTNRFHLQRPATELPGTPEAMCESRGQNHRSEVLQAASNATRLSQGQKESMCAFKADLPRLDMRLCQHSRVPSPATITAIS